MTSSEASFPGQAPADGIRRAAPVNGNYLAMPEDFGEALLFCQLLISQGPLLNLWAKANPFDDRGQFRSVGVGVGVGVVREHEVNALLSQAAHIDAIATEMRLAGRPLHTEFAAEAVRRRALAQQMREAPDAE
jgi:hypothetical protein